MVHKVNELYKTLYVLGAQMPKRDKLGIHAKTEQCCLELFELIVTAIFEEKQNKLTNLNSARIKTEVLKRLVRNMHELGIIEREAYFQLENELIEISKMINGWIRYLTIQTPREARG